MKKQNLHEAKKLTKHQLKSISGGLLNCMMLVPCPPCESTADANGCTLISPHCGQKICRP
ncbi:bacteriocin [Chryseobacterium pennipullorum]|uniref:bacteriocin n=1 Tax=Chryseobacterium pennipullorum TaxID=2258963 RepID=UPI000F4F7362|nr:bacteriocin [Chryseobacterium pennipullorum]